MWETPWLFDSTGTVLMTIGLVILIRRITASGSFYRKVVMPVSRASYGMYLMHMVILSLFSGFYMSRLDCTPAIIVMTAVSSYICVAICAIILRRIPGIGKYICG